MARNKIVKLELKVNINTICPKRSSPSHNLLNIYFPSLQCRRTLEFHWAADHGQETSTQKDTTRRQLMSNHSRQPVARCCCCWWRQKKSLLVRLLVGGD